MRNCRDCKYYRGGWCVRYTVPAIIPDERRICPYFEEV